jgi:NADP-dependent 3-hydroxy acid dehydrogenase YdfG
MKQEYIADKVIVVTGAAGGFGRLICEKTAEMGARVVGADVDFDAMKSVVEGIRSGGGDALAVHTDVTDRAQMQALAAEAIGQFGRIDVMINNAGTMPMAFYADHEIAAEAWDRCIDINIKGVLNGINAAHDQMIKQGRGHIINISSIVANAPAAGAAVYGATKAAVVFLSEALRVESQGKIKVTIVRPSGVPNTGLNDTVINPESGVGVQGHHAAETKEKFEALKSGQFPSGWVDKEDIGYFMLDANTLADQIVYAINQPWGVVISDITVRASGESFVI